MPLAASPADQALGAGRCARAAPGRRPRRETNTEGRCPNAEELNVVHSRTDQVPAAGAAAAAAPVAAAAAGAAAAPAAEAAAAAAPAAAAAAAAAAGAAA